MSSSNIRQRIHAVMKELDAIALVEAKGLKFKIIAHDDVTSALRPLYLKHGIDQEVSVQESRQLDGGTTELLVLVQWVNVDKPDDRKAVLSVGHSSPARQGPDMRRDDLGVGKALSYAVKMAQLKNFALLSGDEDLEHEAAKPAKAMATNDEVEQAMNALAQATTPDQFKVAADASQALSPRCTQEQKLVLSNAWVAAKNRVQNGTPNQPLPESLGGEPKPAAATDEKRDDGLTAEEMRELLAQYGNVRTKAEFGACRVKVSTFQKRATKGQWALLAEYDAKANKLLQMQQEAAS